MVKKFLQKLFGSSTTPVPAQPAAPTQPRVPPPAALAPDQWREGGIYVTPNDDEFCPLKILRVDDQGVHVRLYGVYRSLEVATEEIAAAIASPGTGLPIDIGHAPVSFETFAGWGAIFVQQSTVEPEELEGFAEWEAANGGYF